ncbi:NAD dependent epimerase/dehydratase [Auricularia subglabra TFB-10046 SS5]|uniref:NAD dependent epimerase/dehydratase n=1 Tax=Auricularia subglabra (strain TFB-10046 / SS5) TaxID=717982 RepID=J0D0I7_AURST|nr:NAD dependent epimerase/dehydratase [Auricularia subglabra TFB-10046 SS5]
MSSNAPSAAYLVTGATGAQGGAVARELLKAGQRVHALVRDPSKRTAKELEALGAVLFVGDFDSVDVIHRAAVGVKGIFLNPYPVLGDTSGEARQTQNFVDAARAAGTVESLVLTTAFNTAEHPKWVAEYPDYALRDYYTSKTAAEDAVRGSGVKYWTILRPPWLFQNYLWPQSDFHFPALRTERRFVSGVRRDIRFAQLDGADVGSWAAAAFLDPPRFAGKELRLTAASLSFEDIVDEFEEFAGVKIERSFVEPADLLLGSDDPLGPARVAAAEWQNKGQIDISADEFEELKSYGIHLTSFREFLEKNRAAALATLKVDA